MSRSVDGAAAFSAPAGTASDATADSSAPDRRKKKRSILDDDYIEDDDDGWFILKLILVLMILLVCAFLYLAMKLEDIRDHGVIGGLFGRRRI
ncbi:hypothetical protein CKO28_17525 [Rhodovibrio sodomensis]|uniref:Uncharacterized protein n=1 Tax=Rhodovibrio sodomensis TaxID=1088 RepID=A0ABS1DI01_9PROT|nr:hypothetical protein [Rhodovibrio sodomensis]MBK1669839.1 hypothetical protein [Rhodovibrio sodomensis]